jgi:hypothetical protein
MGESSSGAAWNAERNRGGAFCGASAAVPRAEGDAVGGFIGA